VSEDKDYYLQIHPKHLKELPLERLGEFPILVLDEGLPEGTAYIIAVPSTSIQVTGKESDWELMDKKKKALIKAIQLNPNCVAKITGLE